MPTRDNHGLELLHEDPPKARGVKQAKMSEGEERGGTPRVMVMPLTSCFSYNHRLVDLSWFLEEYSISKKQ